MTRRKLTELDRRLLTDARNKLVAEVRRLGLPVPGDPNKAPPVPCQHGVPWTSCNLCSTRRP